MNSFSKVSLRFYQSAFIIVVIYIISTAPFETKLITLAGAMYILYNCAGQENYEESPEGSQYREDTLDKNLAEYGKDFEYDEAIMTGNGFKGKLRGMLISIPLIFLAAKPGSFFNKIFNFFTPNPGEGPNKKERENGYFSSKFFVFQENSNTSIFKVTGDRDPGYGSTSKMLAESAVCLAKDSLDSTFGLLTPSTAMGDKILDRLQANAGLTFQKIK